MQGPDNRILVNNALQATKPHEQNSEPQAKAAASFADSPLVNAAASCAPQTRAEATLGASSAECARVSVGRFRELMQARSAALREARAANNAAATRGRLKEVHFARWLVA